LLDELLHLAFHVAPARLAAGENMGSVHALFVTIHPAALVKKPDIAPSVRAYFERNGEVEPSDFVQPAALRIAAIEHIGGDDHLIAMNADIDYVPQLEGLIILLTKTRLRRGEQEPSVGLLGIALSPYLGFNLHPC
jgi:hypothetical protein